MDATEARELTSAKMPPPQPTSSTALPSSQRPGFAPSSSCCLRIESRTNWILAGFMRCRSANSPVGSHQCAERDEKCAISAAEMVLVLGCHCLAVEAKVLSWRAAARAVGARIISELIGRGGGSDSTDAFLHSSLRIAHCAAQLAS